MSPRNEELNQQIRDERREQILSAAMKVFARRGFAATKISDIASTAGLSHGLVYHYFSSKDEIFTELVRRAMSGSVMVAEYAGKQPGSPWEQIRWLTETILSEGQEGSAYYYFIVLQAFTSEAVPQEVTELIASQSMIPREQIKKLIVAGQKAGQVVQGDADTLGVAYFSFLQGLILTRLLANESDPRPSAEIVLRILKA